MSKKDIPQSARNVGWAVMSYRVDLKKTREQFAKMCDVSVTTIEHWENGEHRPSFEIINILIRRGDHVRK